MNEDWQPGVVHMSHLDDRIEEQSGLLHAGLGLFRVDDNAGGYGAWSLTHLNSGLRVVALIGRREGVVRLASEIAALADWTFTSIDDWRERYPDLPRRINEMAQRDPSSFAVYPAATQRLHDERPEDRAKVEIARQVAAIRVGALPA